MNFLNLIFIIIFISPSLLVALKLQRNHCLAMKLNRPHAEVNSAASTEIDRSRRITRNVFTKLLKLGAISIVGVGLGSAQPLMPAYAQTSLEAVNVKLADYGLPPVLFEPPGFSTIASEYGRGNIRQKLDNPIIVQFSYPASWISKKTSVNNNGEAGTISAGNYGKGDSAYFYTVPLKTGESLSVDNKDLIKRYIRQSISQKGDVVDDLAISSIKAGVQGVDGQSYIIVDFSYDLNTEAGFLVRRRAVMSLTSVGSALQSITAVTTNQRYKDLSGSLHNIAESFRVYKLNSGVFSTL